MATEPIKVWRYYDAPEELRKLSPHGGDEDWLALIPADMESETWVEFATNSEYSNPASRAFGCCDISEHRLEDGSLVRIGAHS